MDNENKAKLFWGVYRMKKKFSPSSPPPLYQSTPFGASSVCQAGWWDITNVLLSLHLLNEIFLKLHLYPHLTLYSIFKLHIAHIGSGYMYLLLLHYEYLPALQCVQSSFENCRFFGINCWSCKKCYIVRFYTQFTGKWAIFRTQRKIPTFCLIWIF